MRSTPLASRLIWQRILSMVFVGIVVFQPVSTYAEESLCAVVKIEIKQELTLERQAFDAHMRINNGLSNIQLENVQINVSFADEDGNSVRATSDSTDISALFFIRVDSMDGISDVSGSGTVSPDSSADIHWLIIPSAGAGGSLPSGTLYHVGATLSYTLGGEQHTTEVTPDYIYVKPQPQLTLDYFLPRDVYADDAFTLEIEPAVPFTLGVRVKNDGHGAARNLKIDSAQPKIVENKQGLLIGFKIIGSTVNNQSTTPSLLIDFGDIEAEQSAVGRWQMTTTLSGEFTEFNAEFSHSDDLGGELTSLLKATNTHFLVKDVLVELPGRDESRDFLADEGGVLRVYESHGLDTEVNDHSANTTLELMSQSGSEMTYRLNAPVTAGFLYVKLVDPHQGAKAVSQAVRSDGKVLPLDNVWLSKTRREDNGWDYFLNLFDSNSNGQYQITLDTAHLEAQPPVLQFVPNRTTRETQQISFLVEASDPDGTIPTLSATSLPTGAEFMVQDEGRAVFDWTPVKGQAGKYDIRFMASDGTLESSQTASITVNSRLEDSDGDGVLDTCEMQYFGNLERNGSGDFDGDGFLDRDECLQGTDPTVRIAVIINEVDALVAGTEVTEFIELYDGGQGNTSLDGLVVVLLNGELDQTYKALDLDGFTTSAEGYFLIGGSGVTGADLMVSTNDWLADGADAVALYMGDASEFPEGSALTTTRLLDALVYDSDDTNDAGLLALLHSGEPQVNEGGAGNAEGHSLGRCENGAGGQRNSHRVIQALPTPGATNNCQANLSLTITESADSVNIGAGFSYTLTVNNVGPDTAFNMQVVDTLPSGVSFVSASGTDWTCHEASGTVTCELASLVVGAANPIIINVIAPSTAGEITNQATVSAATADPDTANNSVSEVTTVNAVAAEEQADLSLSLAESADLINMGTAFSYTLTVSNAGPQTASNVQLVDTLPSGVSFVSANGTDWSCHEAGGTVTCELASLVVGAANPIIINVIAPSTAGEITNQATVISVTADSDSSNNSVSEVTTVEAVVAEEQTDLSLSLAESADPVNMGTAFSYTLIVSNTGPQTASHVQLVNTLPSGVSFVSASGTDWTCHEASGTVTCELASLVVGAANPITINVIAPSTAGDISNQALVSSVTADSDSSNNSVSEVTIIDARPQPPTTEQLTLTATPSQFSESDGANASTAMVTRTGDTTNALTVNLTSSNASEITVPATITLAAGSQSESFEITAIDDTVVDGTQTVTLTAAADGYTDGTITLTVTDNEGSSPPPTPSIISFSTQATQVLENQRIATLTVTRTGNKVGEITVDYATSDDTAQAGQDYQAASGTLIWRDGEEGEKTFSVEIVDNVVLDGDKGLKLSLGNLTGTNASFAVDTATLTIIDDERPQRGTAQFANTTVEVSESAQAVTMMIRRVGGSDGELVVNYATTAGTAKADNDYVQTRGKLTWISGDSTEKTVTVVMTNDTEIEGNELFTVTLFDETHSESLDSATVFIYDDDIVVELQHCPSRGLIDFTCNAQGETLTSVTVAEGASLANAVLEDFVYNQGWISNSTVQTATELLGGIITGYMTNKGTMTDFEFRGALVKGGTLSGDITNNSTVGGTFKDVHLTANTRIRGGKLQGIITGDVNAPARLENVEVKDNSYLSGVVISDTVKLGDNVVFGEGVRFTKPQLIPTALELTTLLPVLPSSIDCDSVLMPVKRSDLSADVLEPGEGLLAAINALPELDDNDWVITQHADYGYLQLTIDEVRFAVQALSVTNANRATALELLEQQSVRFVTDTGIQVFAHPAVQAPCLLQAGLAVFELPDIVVLSNGNLKIPADDGNWFSARADWVSFIREESGMETGLFFDEHPDVRGYVLAYTVFTDNQEKLRQQFFYPAPAMPESLYSAAQQVVIERYGLVSFKLNGQTYRGVLDYLVTAGTPSSPGNPLQVEPFSDVNGDGKEDWLLIYPNGERQILFQSDRGQSFR